MPRRVFENCPCCGSSSISDGSQSRSGSVDGASFSGSSSGSSGSSDASGSSGSGSTTTLVDGGLCCDLPSVFSGTYEQTAGVGSPASGSLTFTYDDGTGPGAIFGAGWYSNAVILGGACSDTYTFYYRCVTDPGTGISSYKLLVHVEPGPSEAEMVSGGGGVWTTPVPIGECAAAEVTVTLAYDADCNSTGGLMAARPALLAAAMTARVVVDRFPLPLCKYEGAVSEYAGCGCEDKHIRFCELPGQGDNGIPEIDRMTRAYLPDFDMPNCEKCNYRKAPGDV